MNNFTAPKEIEVLQRCLDLVRLRFSQLNVTFVKPLLDRVAWVSVSRRTNHRSAFARLRQHSSCQKIVSVELAQLLPTQMEYQRWQKKYASQWWGHFDAKLSLNYSIQIITTHPFPLINRYIKPNATCMTITRGHMTPNMGVNMAVTGSVKRTAPSQWLEGTHGSNIRYNWWLCYQSMWEILLDRGSHGNLIACTCLMLNRLQASKQIRCKSSAPLLSGHGNDRLVKRKIHTRIFQTNHYSNGLKLWAWFLKEWA